MIEQRGMTRGTKAMPMEGKGNDGVVSSKRKCCSRGVSHPPSILLAKELLFTSEIVAIHGRIGGIAAFVALHAFFN